MDGITAFIVAVLAGITDHCVCKLLDYMVEFSRRKPKHYKQKPFGITTTGGLLSFACKYEQILLTAFSQVQYTSFPAHCQAATYFL